MKLLEVYSLKVENVIRRVEIYKAARRVGDSVWGTYLVRDGLHDQWFVSLDDARDCVDDLGARLEYMED